MADKIKKNFQKNFNSFNTKTLLFFIIFFFFILAFYLGPAITGFAVLENNSNLTETYNETILENITDRNITDNIILDNKTEIISKKEFNTGGKIYKYLSLLNSK